MTLFGERVFADVIKLWISRGDHLGIRWALNPITGGLTRDREKIHRGESSVKPGAETGMKRL